MKSVRTLIYLYFVIFLSLPCYGETVMIDDLVLRDGVYFKKFENHPFTGSISQICPTERPKTLYQEGLVGKIEDGLKEGLWTITKCVGKGIEKGIYSKGTRQGIWEFYYGNGQLSKVGLLRNNLPHGDWTWYDKSGLLIIKDTYVMGELTHFKGYDEDENIERMGPYKNGEPVGTWKFFEDGQLIKTVEYE